MAAGPGSKEVPDLLVDQTPVGLPTPLSGPQPTSHAQVQPAQLCATAVCAGV